MSFQVFQAQGLRIYAGDTNRVNSYVGLAGEIAINTETKSVRILDGVTPGGVPLTTTNGPELKGLNIEQLANLLVTTPKNGEALVYQDGKWTNQAVATQSSTAASNLGELLDVTLTNLQSNQVLSYNAVLAGWENKAVATADHDHDLRYQAKGDYLMPTSNLSELNNVQITMPADGQSLVYDEGYQKWINTTLAGATGGGSIEPPSVIFAASHLYDSSKYYNGEIMGPWTIRHHNGDCFNTNGTFTAPKAGVYRFDYHDNHYDNESNSSQYMDWILNGSDLGWGRIYGHYVGGWENISGHLVIELAQGDTIQLKGTGGIRADGNVYGLWSGYLMHDPAAGGTVISETSPIGMIAPFAMENAPNEWLVCDGSTLNSVANPEYADLFAAIGTTWGGASASDFKLPDLRGAFLRGVGIHGSSTMANNSAFAGPNIGSFENDQMQGHKHEFNNYAYYSNGNNSELVGMTGTPPMANDGGAGSGVGPPKTDGMNGNPRQGDETRPFNAGVLYCIKYKAASGSAALAQPASKDGQLYKTCGYRNPNSTVNFTLDKESKFTVSANGRHEGGTYHPVVTQFVIDSTDGTVTGKTDAWGDEINESYNLSTGVLSIHFNGSTSCAKVDVFYGDLVVN